MPHQITMNDIEGIFNDRPWEGFWFSCALLQRRFIVTTIVAWICIASFPGALITIVLLLPAFAADSFLTPRSITLSSMVEKTEAGQETVCHEEIYPPPLGKILLHTAIIFAILDLVAFAWALNMPPSFVLSSAADGLDASPTSTGSTFFIQIFPPTYIFLHYATAVALLALISYKPAWLFKSQKKSWQYRNQAESRYFAITAYGPAIIGIVFLFLSYVILPATLIISFALDFSTQFEESIKASDSDAIKNWFLGPIFGSFIIVLSGLISILLPRDIIGAKIDREIQKRLEEDI